MSKDELEFRQKIAAEIEHNLKAAFENCACLGRTALNPGPLDESTYVERMTSMIKRNITDGTFRK